MPSLSTKTNRTKIKNLDELVDILASDRAAGKKVVHCHGVFDLLHVGHFRYFEGARTHGDILVVTVTPDQYVNKGPHRPIFTETLRAEAIAALASVDYVAINKWPTAVETLQRLRPDFYVKGPDYKDQASDYTGGIAKEQEAVESGGGKLVFTDDITFSSTHLLNQEFSVFPKETQEYLADFRTRYQLHDLLRHLDALQKLKVLVVGEAIIDEYLYCETLGKSGKEPVLAARYCSTEKFAGGSLAVANHVASFAGSVSLLTFLGKHDTQEEFIRQKLNPKVRPEFLFMENAPTIVKRRFVETYPFQKLFEVYCMGDELTSEESRLFREKLLELLPSYDVVVVIDYGHGMIGGGVIETLTSNARFLAVNTQLNAGNHGFHTIARYPRADYISLSEREMRLEARDRTGDIRPLIEKLSDRLFCDRIMITRGKEGCLSWNRAEGLYRVPAFTGKVVDRVGAGDALFAVSSLCSALTMPAELVGFVANAAGAQAVSIVGNKEAIGRVSLMKFIESLMK